MNDVTAATPFHSGFVAIAGRPNMGKSTFLNLVLGQKVAIVTPKPQTTRNRILGVRHDPQRQIVFLDTPGIHNAKKALNQSMVRAAMEACFEADVILYFVDAATGMTAEDWQIVERFPKGVPLLLVLNKMDRVKDRRRLLPVMEQAGKGSVGFMAVLPFSATRGEGLNALLAEVDRLLPEGPPYFPEEQVTDLPERFLAAEVIREKLFMALEQELPYSLAVVVDRFSRQKNMLQCHAVIHVERDSQKGIVVGRGGETIKRVGIAARKELEDMFESRVDLRLWVRVKQNWTGDQEAVLDFFEKDQ